MNLDIVILYLVVAFLALCLVVRMLMVFEGYIPNLKGLPTYRQQLSIATLQNTIRQMERRLRSIQQQLNKPNISVWYRGYWESQRAQHVQRLQANRAQLNGLVQRINVGPAARIVPETFGGPQAPLFSAPPR